MMRPRLCLGDLEGCVSLSGSKDSECTFGIGKKRFRWLRIPMLIAKKTNVDNIFRTCAILHNLILQYDGLDTIGELDTDCKDINANYNTDVIDMNTGDLPFDEYLEQDLRSQISALMLVRKSR